MKIASMHAASSTLVSRQHPDSQHVAILLCSYNGAKYLPEQIESIEEQSHTDWSLHISDDGSNDETPDIIADHVRTSPLRYSSYCGPRAGFAANFISLLANTEIKAPYYAFADQDDIWEKEKLEKALTILDRFPENIPALYFSRTSYVDESGKQIGLSLLFNRPPCFRNALVQSIGGGNTMVFNDAARELLRKYSDAELMVSHDWWSYLAVTAVDGNVYYDSYASVRYRQHGNNAAGQNITFMARLHRLRSLLSGNYSKWNSFHALALQPMKGQMPRANQLTLDMFLEARSGILPLRLYRLARSGVFRQPRWNQYGLYLAALFRKL